jgi:hypothetical protein
MDPARHRMTRRSEALYFESLGAKRWRIASATERGRDLWLAMSGLLTSDTGERTRAPRGRQ